MIIDNNILIDSCDLCLIIRVFMNGNVGDDIYGGD